MEIFKAVGMKLARYVFYVISLGWLAHIYFVDSIKAEIDDKVKVFDLIRASDVFSINKRLDRIETQNDTIIRHLINKEGKK
jgi:hypothetical protein